MAKKKKKAKKITKKSNMKTAKKSTQQKSTKKTAKKVNKKSASKKMSVKSSKKSVKKVSAKPKAKTSKKAKKSVTEVMRSILEKQQAQHNPIQAELLGEEMGAEDPSQAPGHRNIDLKKNSHPNPADAERSENARHNLTRADKVNQNKTSQRRIITGAAVGKTGRIVSK